MPSSDRQVAGAKPTLPGHCWTSAVDPEPTFVMCSTSPAHRSAPCYSSIDLPIVVATGPRRRNSQTSRASWLSADHYRDPLNLRIHGIAVDQDLRCDSVLAGRQPGVELDPKH